MALLTAAEARLHIPELSGAGEDSNLDTIISRVGAVLAAWCGYPPASVTASPSMETASYTAYIDGPGGRALVLPVWPVTAIASIHDDPEWTWGADALVSSSDYAILDGREGLVLLTETATHGAWSRARRAIKVTFTAGFTSVPADVKQGAILAVRAVYDMRRNQGKTNASGAGPVSVGYRTEEVIIKAAREVLAARRLPPALL